MDDREFRDDRDNVTTEVMYCVSSRSDVIRWVKYENSYSIYRKMPTKTTNIAHEPTPLPDTLAREKFKIEDSSMRVSTPRAIHPILGWKRWDEV